MSRAMSYAHRPLSTVAISRRRFVAGAGGGAVAVASGIGLGSSGCELNGLEPTAGRALRIAHLTDIHVQPEGQAPDGMALAFRHAQSLADPPDLLINGGDCIRDALEADAARTAAQWDVWQRVLATELTTPIVHCIGNHDIWGWASDDPSIEQDPRFGKQWALQVLGLASPFYSFDLGGWHFVVLDSSSRDTGIGYKAELDQAQWQWLVADLEHTPSRTPICVVSHVPLLCACTFFDGPNESTGSWAVPAAWMHIDARAIKDLLNAHRNVKLCLGGHVHLQDRVEYLGVTHLCNGAVCGNWWDGPYQEFGPAYAIIDLFADGSFAASMVPLNGA